MSAKHLISLMLLLSVLILTKVVFAEDYKPDFTRAEIYRIDGTFAAYCEFYYDDEGNMDYLISYSSQGEEIACIEMIYEDGIRIMGENTPTARNRFIFAYGRKDIKKERKFCRQLPL